MAELAWAALDTPVGQVSVGCSQAGVTQIRFGSPPDPPAGPAAGPGAGPDLRGEALTQLAEYFSGRRRLFDLPLDWSATSRLQRQVLGVLFDSVGYGDEYLPGPARGKLTDSQVRQIRDRCMFGEAAQQELAAEFGVSASTVSDIATGKTWGWLA